MMVTMVFSAATLAGAMTSPPGPMMRITSGETGSLKVSFSVAGDCATTAPSAGSARTREGMRECRRAPARGKHEHDETCEARTRPRCASGACSPGSACSRIDHP